VFVPRASPVVVVVVVVECVEGFVDDALCGVLHEVCVLLDNILNLVPVLSVVIESQYLVENAATLQAGVVKQALVATLHVKRKHKRLDESLCLRHS
jgi:hypothetical protein